MKRLAALSIGFLILCGIGHAEPRRKGTGTTGLAYGRCDGTLGSFDVYLVPASQKAETYELYVVPVKVDTRGDVAGIVIANGELRYRQLVPQTVLDDGKEIFAGFLSASDLKAFELLGIVPFDRKGGLLTAKGGKDAICRLPEIKSPAKEAGGSAPKRKAGEVTDYGFTRCDGPLGKFDVYVVPVGGTGPRLYEVTVVPVLYDAKKGPADIAVANGGLEYRLLSTKTTMTKDSEVIAGYLSDSERARYDTLALVPHQAGVTFPEGNADKATLCPLPSVRDRSGKGARRERRKRDRQGSHGSGR